MSELELYESETGYETAEGSGLKLIEDFVEAVRVDGHLRTKASTNSYANEVINRLEGKEGHGDPLIENFVTEAQTWQRDNSSLGADDTASREAFVASVTHRLHDM